MMWPLLFIGAFLFGTILVIAGVVAIVLVLKYIDTNEELVQGTDGEIVPKHQ